MFKIKLNFATIAFIENWMKYHVVSSFVTYGSFHVSAEATKLQ